VGAGTAAAAVRGAIWTHGSSSGGGVTKVSSPVPSGSGAVARTSLLHFYNKNEPELNQNLPGSVWGSRNVASKGNAYTLRVSRDAAESRSA